MAVDFNVEPVPSEDAQKLLHDPRRLGNTPQARPVRPNRASQRTFVVARQRDQSGGELRPFAPEDAALALGGAQVGAGEQAAEVLVAGAVFHQHRQDRAVFHGDFRAQNRTQALFAGRLAETRGAIKAVPVTQGQGAQPQPGGGRGEVLR